MTPQNKIRILIVAPAFPLIGGQAIQAQRLIEKFKKEPDLEVGFLPINPDFLPVLQKIKYVRTVVKSAKFVFELFRNIPRFNVIHIFSASYSSFLLSPVPAMLVAKLFGKKTILNYRSGEADDHLTRSPLAVKLIKQFDRVVTPSGYLVDVFSKFGISAVSIFNFVDTERFTFRLRSESAPKFLANRNFMPLYNVSCVIRAFGLIQKKYADASIVIAGEGEERAKLESLVSELKLKNVRFAGRVTRDEMAALYAEADVYLNSPNIDNMPNSIIEAYTAGVPVVSTNAGGIPYILTDGETGALVGLDDSDAMATRAIELLENPKLAEKYSLAGKCESEKYQWLSVREDWLNCYKSLCDKFVSE